MNFKKGVIKKKRIQDEGNAKITGREKERILLGSLITMKKEDLLRDQRSQSGKTRMIKALIESVMKEGRTINQSGQNGKMPIIKILIENVMVIISGNPV